MQRDGLGLISVDNRFAIAHLFRYIETTHIKIHKPLGTGAGAIELEFLPHGRIGIGHIDVPYRSGRKPGLTEHRLAKGMQILQ